MGYGLMGLFDPMYLIIIGPTILLSLWAQSKVKGAYNKWSKVRIQRNMTGAQAAYDMLSKEGITDVRIEQVKGWLSDHYDPTQKVLRLSPQVYNGNSVASVGIACHEAGHALQHARKYPFLGLRSLLVPAANIGSRLSWIIIFAGMLLGLAGLAKVGVLLFGFVVLFQLVTLPVEFNASSRAKSALQFNGILSTQQEIDGVNKVLDAAAMTYVAATIAALGQLLYFALRVFGGSRDD